MRGEERSQWPALASGHRTRLDWQDLRGLVRSVTPQLRAPHAGAPGCCVVCRAPTGRRSLCAQCELHLECARGSLADLVVPVAYAIKGGPHARLLWQYKWQYKPGIRADAPPRPAENVADAAGAVLRALLLVFLRDHGSCVWRAAGMPGPTHVAVVPTARGRPGSHPLRALIAPYLRGPWAELAACSRDEGARDLDPGRFAAMNVPGARVLLLDDTWTTGASAQSAAMALRRAGARSVVTIVLGRHVGAADQAADGPAAMPFLPESCAVHGAVRGEVNGAQMAVEHAPDRRLDEWLPFQQRPLPPGPGP